MALTSEEEPGDLAEDAKENEEPAAPASRRTVRATCDGDDTVVLRCTSACQYSESYGYVKWMGRNLSEDGQRRDGEQRGHEAADAITLSPAR